MAVFQSELFAKELVIDDGNAHIYAPDRNQIIDGEIMGRGYIPRDFSVTPFGSVAAPIDFPLIPEERWAGIIERDEKEKTRLSDVVDAAGLPCKNQGGTNYCWGNAPVHCAEIERVLQNEPMILLSPGSVCGPVNNFTNTGGWGSYALKHMIEFGVCSVDVYPANQVSRGYWTEDAKANAARHKVLEWYDLRSRNFGQLATMLLLKIPVAIGLNWWRHEVTAYELVILGLGKFGVRCRNSWGMSYGDRGYFILSVSKATPDDAVAIRNVRPSGKPRSQSNLALAT